MRVPLHQTKKGLSALTCLLDEFFGGSDGFIINRFHALLGQRPGVLDLCRPAGTDIHHEDRTSCEMPDRLG